VLRRWAGALVIAAAAWRCTLTTDFGGIADGRPDAASGGASGGKGPAFPRLALFETSNPKDFHLGPHQEQAARVDLNVMGIYPGWEESHATIEEVVQSVKALNPSTKLFVVFAADQFRTTLPDAYGEVIEKLNAMSWWLYESGTSGAIVGAPGTADAFLANTTQHTPKDSNGKTFMEWYAHWSHGTWVERAPSLDGIMLDNVDFEPRAPGDYDRDGDTESPTDPLARQWYREGYRAYFQELAQIAPTKLRLADLDWVGDSEASSAELEGMLHGGFLGSLIGMPYSKEQDSWAAMMTYYRKALALASEPKLVIFHMTGALTDFRSFRYGFASCLLEDGYFAFTDIDGDLWGLEWFDEYDAELGHPIQPPPSIPWSNGVWRRDFEKGIALVNPKGNGPRSLELEAAYRRIAGTQDPSVNDGVATESVTLAERDGIVLLR
jgi:hypothetical protein